VSTTLVAFLGCWGDEGRRTKEEEGRMEKEEETKRAGERTGVLAVEVIRQSDELEAVWERRRSKSQFRTGREKREREEARREVGECREGWSKKRATHAIQKLSLSPYVFLYVTCSLTTRVLRYPTKSMP
jgi:hypothetical protein